MKIIPILDEISDQEKIRKLQVYYPRTKLSTQLTLKFLINRDFTQSNRWTKACALYQIGRLKIADFKYDLIANLFNPDQMVREMAAWGLHSIDADLYVEHANRLNPDIRTDLDSLILNQTDVLGDGNLIFEKVRFLQSMKVFSQITGLLLSYLSDEILTYNLSEGETLNLGGEYSKYFIIIRAGKGNLYENGEKVRKLTSKKFVGEKFDNQGDSSSNLIVALEETRLLLISKDRYYELLSDNLLFAQSVIRHMSA